MWELKRIGVISLAKIYAIISAIFGFVMGIFVTIMTIAAGPAYMSTIGAANPGFAFIPFAVGIFAIIVVPILSGVMGFVMGAITALIYNWVASWSGGVELDLRKTGSFLTKIPHPRRKRK